MRALIALGAALLVSIPGVASLLQEDRPQPTNWPTPAPAVSPIGRETVIQEGTPPVAKFGLLPQSAAAKSQPIAKSTTVYRYQSRRSCGPGGCR